MPVYLTSKGISWTTLDPLTISQTSIRLYQEFDELLCGGSESHNEDCYCLTLQTHYGRRPFKCGFLSCFFSRHGFPTESVRNSHQKHHDQPWKCSRADCPYSQGFLSRNMRDKHWEQCHQEDSKTVCFQQDPDEDEIQPLLFDLVRTDKVQLIKTLIPRLGNCKSEVRQALYRLAVSSGSTAMIDLLIPKAYYTHRFLIAAIHSKNIENYRHILHCYKSEFSEVRYHVILPEILKSKSEEFLLGWEICIDADYEAWRQETVAGRNSNIPYGERFIRQDLLKTARGDPGNEAFILTLWKRINLAKALRGIYLGDALVNVAAACCSVKLAKYLTDAGAAINHRRSRQYLTPLHHAATKNNSEAAELMRFLLVLGADPAAYATSGPPFDKRIRKIRDEAGAKSISKWLGMSWDDLVEKTKLENQK